MKIIAGFLLLTICGLIGVNAAEARDRTNENIPREKPQKRPVLAATPLSSAPVLVQGIYNPPSSPYFPDWANAPAQQIIIFEYDSTQSAAVNGSQLKAAIEALLPGEKLVIAEGLYQLADSININVTATAAAPIRVTGKPNAPPVIVQTNAAKSIFNVSTGTEFVAIHGLDLSGGNTPIQISGSVRNVWIDKCTIHDSAGHGLRVFGANDREYLYLTRNHVHQINGEGMRFDNNAGSETSRAIVALNHIHDTYQDGILINRGFHSSRIAENEIHDTLVSAVDYEYPLIRFFEGKQGAEFMNVIEKNLLYNSADNIAQAEEGGAYFENNLLAGTAGNKPLDSSHNPGTLRNLVMHYNTIVSPFRGAELKAWTGNPANNLAFVDNVIYASKCSSASYAIKMDTGYGGGDAIARNVVYGAYCGGQPVTDPKALMVNLDDASIAQNTVGQDGFAAFTNISSFNLGANEVPAAENYRPAPTGELFGSAQFSPVHIEEDFFGTTRQDPQDAGAIDGQSCGDFCVVP